MSATTSTPHSRRTLLILLLLFFAPLSVAFLVYYGLGWRPAGSTHHGDLITPARPLPEVNLITAEGVATEPHFLQARWSMVYIDNGLCDSECRQTLTLMQHVHLLLNKDISRVQRVLLYAEPCCDIEYFRKQQGLLAVSIDSEPGKQLLAVFPSYNQTPVIQARRLYLVDPLGNLMMSYVPTTAPQDILQDLKKLLKLSHIG